MKKIWLGGKYGSIIGNYALVDDDDFEKVSQRKWCAIFHKRKKTLYTASKRNKKITSLHRFILEAKYGDIIDHIDGNGLNCQRNNLRFCTNSQNLMNREKPINNTSGYKGVSWNKKDKRWISQIKKDGKTLRLGSFKDKKLAAIKYNEMAIRYYGIFANLNKFL